MQRAPVFYRHCATTAKAVSAKVFCHCGWGYAVPRLTVQLFGQFCVRCGAHVVEGFEPHKAQELFAYLLLRRGQHHPRETLCDVLWGESSSSHSKKNLRQTLWQLQGALDRATVQS